MIVFVSDLYADEYIGGAELSTEGLIMPSDVPIIKLKSTQVTQEIIETLKNYHWVFTNTSQMKKECYLEAIKNLSYSVVEFDYKFCTFRSIEKHENIERTCNCENSSFGKLFSVFLAKARGSYFMSTDQRKKYFQRFPFLEKTNSHVLSSVFTPGLIEHMEHLNTTIKKDQDSYLILKSNSWVKGTDDTIKFATDSGIKYEVIGGLPYEELLKKLRQHKGLIFRPAGADTCPRIVIEAALLECDLILSENVQHKNEDWFCGPKEDMKDYLLSRASFFWDEVFKSLSKDEIIPTPTSAPNQKYIFIVPAYNSEAWIYKTLTTVAAQKCQNFECYIGDDISTDNTTEVVQKAIGTDSRFKIIKNQEKKYALKNISDLIDEAQPSDEDVIIILDGDDWLTNWYVLDSLNEAYSNGALATFGSFLEYPTGRVGAESSAYPDSVIENNTFREDTWRASHLKTLKYKVWKDIDKKDFLNQGGEYYDSSYDQAIMLPVLEMCGSRAVYVPKILCVYNTGNPNAVVKSRQNKQHKNMLDIRSKKVYSRKEYDEHTPS